jgi:hypothetical protein
VDTAFVAFGRGYSLRPAPIKMRQPLASAGTATRAAPDYSAMNDEASYYCDHCGEEIVVPVDYSAGREQTYVEDCPVCCHPHVIHVHIDEDGELWLTGDAE